MGARIKLLECLRLLPQVIAHPDPDFLTITPAITIGLCLTTFGGAFMLGRLLHVDHDQMASLMYGLGMNNNGAGLVIATLALPSYPRVMLPIIFYNLVQHLVAGIVHIRLCRKGKRQEC